MISSEKEPIRLVLAPLLGVTTSAFRRTFARHFPGVGEALAPFIVAARSSGDFRKLTRDLRPENNRGSMPVIPQLVGNDGAEFAGLAHYLREELGYEEVNWNIGCAAGTTPSRLRGAALLAHPDLVDRFLGSVFAAFSGKVSLKMRLGMREPTECLALLPVLNRYPLHEISVHPRTGLERFSGALNLEIFSELREGLRHAVVFNGEITTTAGAQEVQRRFPGLAGLMLGRGLVSNPWLAQAIREGTPERSSLSFPKLRLFHDDLFALYQETMEGGAHPVLGRMKELWPYWEPLWSGRERLVRRVVKARSLEAYHAAVDEAFSNNLS